MNLKLPEFQRKTDQLCKPWLNGRNTDAYVYSYMDKTGNQMQYIGMTNNLDARALQHGNRFGTRMMPAELNKKMLSENADSLPRRQARALEELGIDSHGMAKEDGLLLNARHEIGINGSAGKEVRNGALKWAQYMVDSEAIRVYGM